jgi:hypothetical protein
MCTYKSQHCDSSTMGHGALNTWAYLHQQASVLHQVLERCLFINYWILSNKSGTAVVGKRTGISPHQNDIFGICFSTSRLLLVFFSSVSSCRPHVLVALAAHVFDAHMYTCTHRCHLVTYPKPPLLSKSQC